MNLSRTNSQKSLTRVERAEGEHPSNARISKRNPLVRGMMKVARAGASIAYAGANFVHGAYIAAFKRQRHIKAMESIFHETPVEGGPTKYISAPKKDLSPAQMAAPQNGRTRLAAEAEQVKPRKIATRTMLQEASKLLEVELLTMTAKDLSSNPDAANEITESNSRFCEGVEAIGASLSVRQLDLDRVNAIAGADFEKFVEATKIAARNNSIGDYKAAIRELRSNLLSSIETIDQMN